MILSFEHFPLRFSHKVVNAGETLFCGYFITWKTIKHVCHGEVATFRFKDMY